MTETERLAAEVARLNGRWERATEQERAAHVERLIALSRADPNAEATQRATDGNPLVSIIVAARNYSRFLAECLGSCTRQTYKQIELIYSDDASEDDSIQIASQFPTVKVLASKLHSGTVETRNRGYRLSRGQILIFVDGDDMLPDDFVASRVSALTSGNYSFCYGGVQSFGRDNHRAPAPEWGGREALWVSNFCDTSSAIWRHVFEEVGGWREAPGNCWDWDLWLRASQFLPPVKCDSYLLYRLHDTNNSITVGHASPGRNWEQMRHELRLQAIGKPPAVRQRPLRVGFAHPTIVLGGAEQWLLSLIRSKALNNEHIAVSGVALTGDGPHTDAGRVSEAKKHVMLLGGPRCGVDGIPSYPSVQEAVRALAKESDVLVWWSALPIRETLGDYAGPVVHVSHGALVWAGELDESGSSEATHRVAVSKPSAARFGKLPFTVIHNGVDPDRCESKRPRNEIRRELGLKRGDIAIGYVGRFSWEKNPLAPAIAAAELGKPYRAVLVGSGWQETEIRRAARSISRSTLFVPDTLFVGDALSALDCVVLASESEGFSLSLTEAWLAGRPTVATPVGAVPELEREHGKLTVTITVGASPQQLAKAVRAALAAKNKPIVARAEAVARKHYTAAAMAERWATWLLRIKSN